MTEFSRILIASIFVLALPTAGVPAEKDAAHPPSIQTAENGPAVLWRDPVDIASRSLYYGPGGKAHEPHGPFTFEREDKEGSSPKFDVVDQDGVKWRVKLGSEARPETAASRLVWAAGYFANEDYFMETLQVRNMPRLRRGKGLVSKDGTMHNVRLKRRLKDQKKLGVWSWKSNPFTGTQEWHGLRVLMALINNWDLKDSNNSVYQVHGDHPEQRYIVADLGASFGSPGLNWQEKGDLKSYSHSTLVSRAAPEFIDFNVPALPRLDTIFYVPEMARRAGLCWIGRRIPRADAKWMGQLLSKLSPEQIRDAFRASGYSPQEVEAVSQVVERRIAELKAL